MAVRHKYTALAAGRSDHVRTAARPDILALADSLGVGIAYSDYLLGMGLDSPEVGIGQWVGVLDKDFGSLAGTVLEDRRG